MSSGGPNPVFQGVGVRPPILTGGDYREGFVSGLDGAGKKVKIPVRVVQDGSFGDKLLRRSDDWVRVPEEGTGQILYMRKTDHPQYTARLEAREERRGQQAVAAAAASLNGITRAGRTPGEIPGASPVTITDNTTGTTYRGYAIGPDCRMRPVEWSRRGFGGSVKLATDDATTTYRLSPGDATTVREAGRRPVTPATLSSGNLSVRNGW